GTSTSGPEYLNPIQGHSIELDAKKSPLALLAQTCSSIGADLTPKGSGGGDKSSSKGKSSSPGAKSPGSALTISPSDDTKASGNTTSSSSSSFKPYEKKDDDDRVSPGSKRTSPSARSPAGSQPSVERSSSRGSDSGRSSSRPRDPPSSSSSSLSPRVSSSPLPPKSSSLSSHSLAGLGDLTKDPLAAYKLAPSLYPHLALGLDPLGAAGLSALTAKVPTSTSAAFASPYIGYARVKTASGNEMVVPVCRDPYCSGCQVNTHAAQIVSGTCPPGCSQCAQLSAHTKHLASLPGLLPTLPASTLCSLYPPPGLVGGSHQHPYVCNWIAGDTYCGKRFSTSEELLQHLRTHTNTSDVPSSLPHHLHPLLAAGPLPRGYPTPPLSPLSAARYHPYAKPPLGHLAPTAPLPSAFSAAASLTLPPHPLSAYYNPYSLYARGLGSTMGLH
ncbi:hypothetical protein Pcinc_033977, partial [Petrolisthes cinctipes]